MHLWVHLNQLCQSKISDANPPPNQSTASEVTDTSVPSPFADAVVALELEPDAEPTVESPSSYAGSLSGCRGCTRGCKCLKLIPASQIVQQSA